MCRQEMEVRDRIPSEQNTNAFRSVVEEYEVGFADGVCYPRHAVGRQERVAHAVPVTPNAKLSRRYWRSV